MNMWPLDGNGATLWLLVLVFPVATLLLIIFIGSWWLLGQRLWTRPFGFWLGMRFLFSQSNLMLMHLSTLAIFGVTLGVWLILVTLGILAGFEEDLLQRMIGVEGHVIVKAKPPKTLLPLHQLTQFVQASGYPTVGQCVYTEGEVIIASNSSYTGGMLYGLRTPECLDVLTLFSPLQANALQTVTVPPTLFLGEEMARTLMVQPNDIVRVVSPRHEVMTPIGNIPKSVGFRVGGIFSGKMVEFDSRYAYTSLQVAQNFLEFPAATVSGMSIWVQRPQAAATLVARLRQLPQIADYHLQDWQERNHILFAALKLEKLVSFIVLVCIVLVGGFAVCGTIAMRVIEKKSDIAILQSCGAQKSDILIIFLSQGLLLGGVGCFLGTVLGWLTLVILQHWHLGIPTDIYYIDALPVRIHVSDVLLVLAATLLIVWDFSVLPSYTATLKLPAEGLRDR